MKERMAPAYGTECSHRMTNGEPFRTNTAAFLRKEKEEKRSVGRSVFTSLKLRGVQKTSHSWTQWAAKVHLSSCHKAAI